ncbi:hypothetical protein [Proteiniclasticum ruminis]|nr:hypothetical protein [Proteiniclasticum ruminis]
MDPSGKIDLRIDPFIGPWYFDGDDIQFVVIDPCEDKSTES